MGCGCICHPRAHSCRAVIELPDRRWAAFEVRLGSSPVVVDAAATGLIRLRSVVGGAPPVALGVVTGTGYSLVDAIQDAPNADRAAISGVEFEAQASAV